LKRLAESHYFLFVAFTVGESDATGDALAIGLTVALGEGDGCAERFVFAEPSEFSPESAAQPAANPIVKTVTSKSAMRRTESNFRVVITFTSFRKFEKRG
jgi:hypothetical protein